MTGMRKEGAGVEEVGFALWQVKQCSACGHCISMRLGVYAVLCPVVRAA